MNKPIINGWTKKTLVIDLVNSLGEKYHFEIAPGEKDNLPTKSSDGDPKKRNGVFVQIEMPLINTQ